MHKKKLLIIDGYGFVFRAYHVQPPLTSKEGKPVGAIYGFTSMMIKLLNDFKDVGYLVVVFDTGSKNFRHELYSEYKANRAEVDEDLVSQLPIVRDVAKSLNVPILEENNVEADDVIATIANKAKNLGVESVIISSDKDLMQLIDDDLIKMYDPLKAKYISKEDVVKKFGVMPDLVHDMLALIGDSSDNIPGAKGIGPKTALTLLNKFGNLENLLENKNQIDNLRIRQLVIDSEKNILLSWKLTELQKELSLDFSLDNFVRQMPDVDKITNFLQFYNFKSLVKRIESLCGYQINFLPEINNNDREITPIKNVDSLEEFNALYKDIKYYGVMGIYLFQQKNINPIIFITVNNYCYTINFEIVAENFTCGELFQDEGKSSNKFFGLIKNIIEDATIKKITFNLKAILRFFTIKQKDLVVANACEDLELMTYTLTAGLPQNSLIDVDLKNLSKEEITQEVSKIVLKFEQDYQNLVDKLLKEKVFFLYKEIDLPISYILYNMEVEGISIDLTELNKLSKNFGEQIKQLESRIFNLAKEEFNIASVKQLGEVLFKKLNLPFAKTSTKNDSFSTGADVLEKLSIQGYEIADLVLKWRSLFKLKTTYADSLPTHLKNTGRIHTCFLQNSTSTSRLSSQEPNLQNIPIRNKEGSQVRAVFVAKPGYKFISADYSQIELRILAHIADIKSLKQAFINNIDIHTDTAMRIFDLQEEELTSEHRRKAKAMNFGIIYGISAFGLAKQLNISNQLADEYIKKYFLKYPGIEKYMNETKVQAKQNGYVTDLFGRRCYVPLINEKKINLINIAERAAINAPIQGTNAEIIKIAMINIHKTLLEKKLHAKLILQIHDELLFEVPENEVNMVLPLIKNCMENAYPLTVPLLVDSKIGDNWQNLI